MKTETKNKVKATPLNILLGVLIWAVGLYGAWLALAWVIVAASEAVYHLLYEGFVVETIKKELGQ